MGRGEGSTQAGGWGGGAMSDSALEKRLEANQGGAGVSAEQLNRADQKAIQDYIGKFEELRKYDINAEDLNRAMYDPKWLAKQTPKFQKEAAAAAKDLDRALSKIKDYKGDTWRLIDDMPGMQIVSPTDIRMGPGLKNIGPRAEAMTPGSIVTMPSVTSASRVRNAQNFNYRAPLKTYAGVTRMKIQSKTGKSIERIANDLTVREREVLFRAGTKFKVTSRKFNRRMNTWDVTLTEL